jgi:NADPH-dependent 2,4-dienoyl-CoA reductase/sulfur reductase-like enzyme
MSERGIVVVGASLAGLRAVETLRREGYEGRLALVGAEPHAPYDRPPLSKQLLAGEWDAERIAFHGGDLSGLELDLRLGVRATGLDAAARELALEGGETLGFDSLVIATGAAPRQLGGAPALEGIHPLRTLDDALAVRAAFERGARVAVIGGGFIGAEVAATARGRGLDVTVVEALELPLVHALGPEMAAVCAGLHRDHGVDLRTGALVTGIEGGSRVERLVLADGSHVEADVVVVAVGVSPQTGWLASSGLTIDDGVVCDATGFTGLPGVYAAGDVARWHSPLYGEALRIEHWTSAAEQGAAAARALLAGPADARPLESVPFFWSDQYDAKIQFAGLGRGADEVRIVHGSVEERRFVAAYGRAGRLVGALALSSARQLMGYRRLVARGATMDEALAHAAAAAGA